MRSIKIIIFALLTIIVSAQAIADYETFTSQIDQIYLYDNGTNNWGIRIKLTNPGTLCDEWYIKMDTALRDQMYSLALAAQAQNKEVTLMRRNASEDISNNGNICGVHRIYSN